MIKIIMLNNNSGKKLKFAKYNFKLMKNLNQTYNIYATVFQKYVLKNIYNFLCLEYKR